MARGSFGRSYASARISSVSISGHMTDPVINTVDAIMMISVDGAGRRPVRRICQASQLHAPVTARTDATLIHRCKCASDDRIEPVPARMVAGSVNGRMQHAPQASAPADNVMAVAPTAFAPGGSFEAGLAIAHPQCERKGSGESVQATGAVSVDIDISIM